MTQNAHPLSYVLEHLQRPLQLFLRMRRCHDRTDACFAFGHGGERNACAKDALIEQFAREVHRQFAVPYDNRRNWGLAGRSRTSTDIEADPPEFFFQEASILPKF